MKFKDIEYWEIPHYRPESDWNDFVNGWLVKKDDGTYWHSNMEVVIQPDFQRSYVWTQDQQIAYIESMLTGSIAGRELYFNHPTWGSFENADKYPIVCVDGQQRIGAVFAFFENRIPVFGHYFSEYEDRIPSHTAYFYININNLKTDRKVYEWYIHLNSGGTVHTKEELDKVRALIKKEEQS